VPEKSGRFLGDASGMAEFVNNSVLYCRHANCWKLHVAKNSWSKVGWAVPAKKTGKLIIKRNTLSTQGEREEIGIKK
jgi:hypothetical protein